ncbi:hypothetical protein Y032_0522g2898 [Ancylostoma ceylanicum]|nr:hypothetical protein Y032_0522g2898 [Ancylostoma ceylanicum]
MKSGYHHVSVHAEFTRFFGFHWNNRFFVFKVLPFGFCSVPFIFTKLFKPLLTKWRKFGINICLYLDDGVVCGESAEEVKRAVQVICQDFVEAGVTLSYEKCSLIPQSRGTWLGFVIDLEKRELRFTEERMNKAVRRLQSMRCSKSPSLRERLRLIGTLNSMWFILESEPQLYTRALNDAILSAEIPLDHHIPLNPDEDQELQYWEERFSAGGFVKKFDTKEYHPSFVIFSDASNMGLGTVLYTATHREEASSNIPPEYISESSTLRELLAVKYALEVWKETIKNTDGELRIDNKNVATILEKGSSNPRLHSLVHQVLSFLYKHNINLHPKWIPRALNEEADFASRLIDYDDWGIQHNVSHMLQSRWGTIQLDMFATASNAKTEFFVGRSRSPAANQIAVDALAPENFQLWRDRFLWLVPPPALIHATVSRLQSAKGRAILGMPYWPSHRSFSALKQLGGAWITEVRDCVLFPTGSKILTKPSVPAVAFPSEFLSFPFLFVLLDFSHQHRPGKPLEF